MAEFLAIDLRATAAVGRYRQLPLHFFGHRVRQPLGRGQQDGRGVHIVLRLRQHVGRQVPRIAVLRDDQDLRGTGHKIDPHFPRQQFLGRRHIDVARPHDPVGPRHRPGPERKRRDGLRPAHLEHAVDSQHRRRPEDLRHRPVARPRRCSARPATCAGTTVIIIVEGRG